MDPCDLGTVYVYTVENKFICQAVNPQYAGVDPVQHAKAIKTEQRRLMNEQRAEMKQNAKKQAVANVWQDIMEQRESQIENIVDLPKPSESHTTDALEETAKAASYAAASKQPVRPIDITEKEESSANDVINLAEKREKRGLPATEQEAYEMLASMDYITANDEQWMTEWDEYLITGERYGLLAAGYQPFAAASQKSREAGMKRR